MTNVVYLNTYKLKEGKSAEDFMLTAEKLSNEFISKHKGFVSLTFLVDGDNWADYLVFETMDDLMALVKSTQGCCDLTEEFYSFIDDLENCMGTVYTVMKDFKPA